VRPRPFALRGGQVALQSLDAYDRKVARVAEYLRERIMRGRDLRGLVYDCACQFPAVRLSIFNDALVRIYTDAGTDGFPTGQMQ
jgi:hypothetical protein